MKTIQWPKLNHKIKS